MKFQAFHVNPGEKLKKKVVNNDLSNFMSVFPITYTVGPCLVRIWIVQVLLNTSDLHSAYYGFLAFLDHLCYNSWFVDQ